jgi:hypothetical protein
VDQVQPTKGKEDEAALLIIVRPSIQFVRVYPLLDESKRFLTPWYGPIDWFLLFVLESFLALAIVKEAGALGSSSPIPFKRPTWLKSIFNGQAMRLPAIIRLIWS